jgi:hypothetical protein
MDEDENLKQAVEAARAGRYAELYEEYPTREDLEDACAAVVAALPDPALPHVVRVLFEEAATTLVGRDARLAARLRVDEVRRALTSWCQRHAVALNTLGCGVVGDQAVSEAVFVVRAAECAMCAVGRGAIAAAVADMLDLVLQGYVVFPGSDGRRALLDWFLDEVVPTSVRGVPARSFASWSTP